MFASGIRVSELCTITCDNLNLDSQVVLIRGKGSKERKIYLASAPVVRALKEYLQVRVPRIADEPFFFLNRDGNRLSEQSVRRIINRYTDLSNQPGHYTHICSVILLPRIYGMLAVTFTKLKRFWGIVRSKLLSVMSTLVLSVKRKCFPPCIHEPPWSSPIKAATFMLLICFFPHSMNRR